MKEWIESPSGKFVLFVCVPLASPLLTGLMTNGDGTSIAIAFLAAVALAVAVWAWLLYRTLRHSGIQKISPSRQKKLDAELAYMQRAKERVDIVGIMHRAFWSCKEDFEKVLLELGRRGIEIRVYVCDVNSPAFQLRAKQEGEIFGDFQANSTVTRNKFKQFATDHPNIRLRLMEYSDYPVWHAVCVDGRELILGWYPEKRDGFKSPLYWLTSEGGAESSGVAGPFINYINSLEQRAHPIDLQRSGEAESGA
jgi:hypothetical protein